jgi:hypothetical protein
MKLKLLVADEIRPEATGKQTVLGLFADDVVVAQPPAQVPEVSADVPSGIERLAFLINVSDLPAGTYRVAASLLDPSGEPYGEIHVDHGITVDAGKSHTFVVEAKPFILRGFGIYQWTILIGDTEARLPFEIRMQSQS